MYGVIFDFLRDYTIERHGGRDTWNALLGANGHSNHKIFFPTLEYPDEQIVALAQTASQALDLPLPVVLEDFGAYTAGKLLSFYHMYTDGVHDTFGVIEKAGGSIHHAIHRHNPDRKPPALTAHRESDDFLEIHYRSQRQLCDVVKGIVRGLGERFDERFAINETQCMHDGASECIIGVKRLA